MSCSFGISRLRIKYSLFRSVVYIVIEISGKAVDFKNGLFTDSSIFSFRKIPETLIHTECSDNGQTILEY